MKRAFTVTLLVLATVAVIAGALPWWLGARAERALEAIADAIDGTRELSVVERHYRRSWLHGEGSIRIAVAGSDEEVVLRESVEHGPFPPSRVAAGHFGPLAVVLRIYSDDGAFAPAESLVDLSAEISLNGVVRGKFTTGAFAARLGPQRDLQVGPSRGTLHVARAGDRLRGMLDLSLPQFSVQEEHAQTAFTNVDLRVDAFSGKRSPLELIVERWKLNADGLRFAPRAGGRAIELKGVALDTGWSKPTAISDGHLTATCDSLAAGDTDYGPGRIEITAESFDRDALRRMDRLFARARENGVPPPRAEILNAFADAARHGTRLTLRELTLGTGSRALEASASLEVDGTHPGLGEETVALIEATQLQFNARIPEPMLHAVLAGAMHRQYEQGVASGRLAELDDDDLNTRIAQGVDLQIRNLLESGYLRTSGERYSVEATVTSGRLAVNGQPMASAPAGG